MIKWRFGLIFGILFLLLLYVSINPAPSQHYVPSRKSGREVLQIDDVSTQHSNTISEYETSNEKVSIRRWMNQREGVYRKRQDRVSQMCKAYNVSSRTNESAIVDLINSKTKKDKEHYVERIALNEFYLSRPHNTLACLVNKVASSSMVKTFLFLAGFDIRNIKSPHSYSARLNPKSWEELAFAEQHFVKFLIVRDPLERLASCYMDKMVTNTHWSLKKFRKQVKNFKPKTSSTPSFKFFIRRRRRRKRDINHFFKLKYNGNITLGEPTDTVVFKQTYVDRTSLEEVNTLASRVRTPRNLRVYPKPDDIPTFSQFLEFIISTDLLGIGFESHWVPYWRACTPCTFKYDAIAKLETGEDDLTYIWKLTGLDREVPIPWENRQKLLTQRRQQLSELYRGVDRRLLIKVFKAYKLDYEMFGYDFNDVLKMADYPKLTKSETLRLDLKKQD